MIRSNFCFSWDFSPTKCHPDLKIYASDTKSVILAHRAVLASHSCLLKTAFLSSDVQGEAVLILPDFSWEDVEQMLQLLYGQISNIINPGEIFSVLGLNPDFQESEFFVDQDESELIFETMKSEIIVDDKGSSKRPPRSKPKVFTDPTTNLIANDPLHGADNEAAPDVDNYIVSEPSNIRPWLCQICLISNVRNPYRAKHKHNLKYHIIKKHFKMEIPKNWQVCPA